MYGDKIRERFTRRITFTWQVDHRKTGEYVNQARQYGNVELAIRKKIHGGEH